MNVTSRVTNFPESRSVTLDRKPIVALLEPRKRDTLAGQNGMSGAGVELRSHDGRIEPLRVGVVEIPLTLPRRRMRSRLSVLCLPACPDLAGRNGHSLGCRSASLV